MQLYMLHGSAVGAPAGPCLAAQPTGQKTRAAKAKHETDSYETVKRLVVKRLVRQKQSSTRQSPLFVPRRGSAYTPWVAPLV